MAEWQRHLLQPFRVAYQTWARNRNNKRAVEHITPVTGACKVIKTGLGRMEITRHLLCLNSGSASFEGPGLWGLRRWVFRRGTVVKWDGLAFGAFPGCVTGCLHPYVVIFSLSLFFFGRTKNLGICEATKDSSGASSKNRLKKKEGRICGLHLEEPSRGVVT